jgi:formate hydrogenlyase subunit 6/NADH:ubiquinone oxidoreductase subunit I
MSSFNILPKAKLADWVAWLAERYRVYGPKPSEGHYSFGVVKTADELDLNYTQTELSARKCIFPPRELLYTYETSGMRVQAVIDSVPTVILGVHTCDQHAIRLLDRVFSQGFTEQHYRVQRDKTLIVGIGCQRPCNEQSFCRSMGTTSPATDVFDLHLVDLGDEYCVEVGSARGHQLVAEFRGMFVASATDIERRDEVLRNKWESFPYRLDCDATDLPELVGRASESKHWQELGDICLACGMCTQVCPTCYCFNIDDQVDLRLQRGSRYRSWDSCQTNEFAMVAGGHDFRSKRAARQRHRFLRKAKFQYEANDMVGCVGCGRCATACLVHISPITTFNELWRKKNQAVAEGDAQP